MNRVTIPVMAALATLVSSLVHAAELDVSLHVGDTYTDNVGYASTDPVDDHVIGAASKIAIATQGPRLDGQLVADLTYLHYAKDSFDDQFLRGFAGDMQFGVTDNLRWVASENYGPVLEDPLSTDRPDNWTYDNYFTTGPDILLGVPAKTHLLIGARYGRVDYQSENVPGNHQYSANLSLVMPRSSRSEASLNFTGRQVRSENTSGAFQQPDFDTGEAYARFESTTVRNNVFIDAGASLLKVGNNSSTSPLARLGWGRRLSSRIAMTLSGGMQYQDTLGRFQRLQNGAGAGGVAVNDPREDVANSSSPMLEKYADWLLSFDGQRTLADFRLAYSRVEYTKITDPIGTQNYMQVSLGLQRRVTPTWTLALDGSYDRRDFADLNRTDDNITGSVSSVWRVAPKFEIQLGYYHRQRESDVSGAGFTARSVQLEFVYRPYSQISSRARSTRWQNIN